MELKIANKEPRALDDLIESFDSKMFKALADPTRTQIIRYLMLHGRSDISTIANHFPQDRSVISRHLNKMADAGLLCVEKETKYRFYMINCETFLKEFETVVASLKTCISECCPPKG